MQFLHTGGGRVAIVVALVCTIALLNVPRTAVQAEGQGKSSTDMLIASQAGANARVAEVVRSLGGTILQEEDTLDYLRVRLPADAVKQLTSNPNILAIEADNDPYLDNPKPLPPVVCGAHSVPGPRTADDEEALLHPYDPASDTDASALKSAHPSYDGRGVTVADIEGPPDFLHADMQQAKDLQGHPIPKFLDIRTGEPPDSLTPYSPWLKMDQVAHTDAARHFKIGDEVFTAPYSGEFRFAQISTRMSFGVMACSAIKGAHLSDFHPVSVLWDKERNVVYLDTNFNNRFDDEQPLKDYSEQHDVAVFSFHPTDPQARGSMGAVVQTAPDLNRVAVLWGADSHATGASGTIAANGLVHGIAPEAQVLMIDGGFSGGSLIDAVMQAEENPRTDIVTAEIVNNGEVERVIFSRLVQIYQKPLLMSASNAPFLSGVVHPCSGEFVLCIGAYQSRNSFLIDQKLQMNNYDNFHPLTTFGPAADGGLEPALLAPSGFVSIAPAYRDYQGTVKGVFSIRVGATVFGGTSQASPAAAGLFATIISAAKQEHVPYTRDSLVRAVEATARYIPRFGAYQQGNGLIQVAAALQYLRHHTQPQHILFTAPVATAASNLLPVPNVGLGYFEREGWSVGERKIRTIHMRRLDGPAGIEKLAVKLVGNDGTFSFPAGISLPQGKDVAATLAVSPKSYGVHSSLLQLYSGQTLVGETLLTVVVPHKLQASNNYTIHTTLNVPLDRAVEYFVYVPPNMATLRVMTNTRSTWMSLRSPENGEAKFLAAIVVKPPQTIVVPHPHAGTWEFAISLPIVSGIGRQPESVPVTFTTTRSASMCGPCSKQVSRK